MHDYRITCVDRGMTRTVQADTIRVTDGNLVLLDQIERAVAAFAAGTWLTCLQIEAREDIVTDQSNRAARNGL